MVNSNSLQSSQTQIAGRLRTWLILIHAALVTLKISVFYIAYTYRYHGAQLRQKGNDLLHWWSQKLLKAAQLNFTVNNFSLPNLADKRPYIIMSNHRSFYDIPLILLAAKMLTVRMVTKQELFKIPLWGRALRLSEFIPLNRQNKRLAVQQLKYAKTKLDDGITLWISPEGTRSQKDKMQPFKNGGFKLAKQMDAVIIPAFIHYSNSLFDHQQGYHLGVQSTLYFGLPIDTRDFQDINLLRDHVYQAIETASNS